MRPPEGVRSSPVPIERSEGDHAAKRFTGLQGVVGLVDFLDWVACSPNFSWIPTCSDAAKRPLSASFEMIGHHFLSRRSALRRRAMDRR